MYFWLVIQREVGLTCACPASSALRFRFPNSLVVFKLLIATYTAKIRLKGVAAALALKWLRDSVVSVRMLALTAGSPRIDVETFTAR